MKLPRLLFLSLGGTITMTGTTSAGIAPTLTGANLVEAVPALRDIADIDVRTIFGIPGAALTFAQIAEVATLIDRELAGEIDGAIVAQGTDTIEDTAFLLDLLISSHKPVVVTGAMRGAQAPGADGPANVLAAAIVAGSPSMAEQGVLVVLNDEVHSARYVRKISTSLTSAFASPVAGPIATVVERRVRPLLWLAQRGLHLPLPVEPVPPVAHIALGLSDDGRMLGELARLGYAAAVVEGMGAGHVPAITVPALARLAETMPVVLSTRVLGGPIFTGTYGFAGSEIDLIARGIITSGMLGPAKSRLLLSLLVGNGAAIETIRDAFAHY